MSNILVIECRRSIGGGQIMTKRIGDVLSKQHNISVLIPDGETPISHYLNSFRQFTFPFIEYNNGQKRLIDIWRFLVNFRNSYRVIKRILENESINMVYIQSPSIIPIIACLAKKYDIKVIAHLHVYHLDLKSRYLLNLCLSSRVFSSIVGVSDYTLSQLNFNNKKKSILLHNYISNISEFPRSSVVDQNKVLVSVIGDVMEAKGQKILFEALQKTSINIELLIIGRIVEPDYYEEIISNAYSFSFRFIGYVENVPDYLKLIDLVVIPSIDSETFSLSMVEAWGYGVPTIASSLGGMKELVCGFLNEYKGLLLFEPSDTENLKGNITRLIQDSSLYKEISEKVYNVSKDAFSSVCFESKLSQIVNRVLAD